MYEKMDEDVSKFVTSDIVIKYFSCGETSAAEDILLKVENQSISPINQ
jgi:hypothetical protein